MALLMKRFCLKIYFKHVEINIYQFQREISFLIFQLLNQMKIRNQKPLADYQIPQSKYILIDCDVGGDDAMCIIMAKYLAEKYDKQIVGITCVQGNTKLQNVVTNSVISSKIAGLKVPIAKGKGINIEGAWRTILGNEIGAEGDGYFHQDGIGGYQQQYNKLISNEDRQRIWKIKAYEGLILASKKYGKQLSILALGPLTNLATAYMIDNQLPERINSISIMGGSYTAMGRHAHFSADFNFHLDPEAANIVIQNYKNIILTTIQYTSDFKLKHQDRVFQNRQTFKGNFIADLYSPLIARGRIPVLCDPLASFALFCPKQANVMVYQVWGAVILHGTRTKGMLSIDWLRSNKDKECNNRILIISQMNKEFVQNVAINSLLD